MIGVLRVKRCMGGPQCFSTILMKGDNFKDFLFVTLDNESLPMGYTLKGKNSSYKSKLCPLRVDTNQKGGKNENRRVASPESAPIHLKYRKNSKNWDT